MKVLHVNAFDTKGGASRAANRLHNALIGQGIESSMLVQSKLSNSPLVITEINPIAVFFNKILTFIDTLPARILRKDINNFSPSWIGSRAIIKKINSLEPDIVHLHWICNGMLSIKDLAKIKPPVVWTLHDNWAFSGACHNLHLCKRHDPITHQCGTFSKLFFETKKKAYRSKSKLGIISPSQWLLNMSKKSILLQSKQHFHLPNPIDTDVFKSINQSQSRELWKLPKDKKIILCGALNILSDPNKGLDVLLSAWAGLKDNNITLVVFGNNQDILPGMYDDKIFFVGKIDNDASLNTLYDAADAVVVPSLQENFSNTILESLACSTPVIAFNVGGNADLIHHNINGYLAQPFDELDLITGIQSVLKQEDTFEIKRNARQYVIDNFSYQAVAEAHKKMYINFLSTDTDPIKR